MQLLDLPRDSLIGIFFELPTRDIFAVTRVCKTFHEIVTKHYAHLFRFADTCNVAFIGDKSSGKTTLIKNTIKQLHQKGLVTLKSVFPAFPTENKLPLIEQLDQSEKSSHSGIRIYFLETNFIEQPSKCIALIDVPLHKKTKEIQLAGFVAHILVCVISASPNENHSCGLKSIYRQLFLAGFTMGAKELVLVVNKMDTINYSEEEFTKIVEEFSSVAKRMGFQGTKTQGIPVVASEGLNLTQTSLTPHLSWFPPKSLFAHIRQTIPLKHQFAPAVVKASPLRASVIHPFGSTTSGVALVYIISGLLRIGQKIKILPHGFDSQVKEIRMYGEIITTAIPGDIVTVQVDTNQKLERGTVLANLEVKLIQVKKFTANIIMMNSHVNQIQNNNKMTASFFFHTGQVTCRFTSIVEKIHKTTGKQIEASPRAIKQGDAALVEIEPLEPFFLECFAVKTLPGKMGRFVFMDLNKIVGVGVVKSVQ